MIGPSNHDCMFAFTDPNSGVTYRVFLKILKSRTIPIFLVKTRHLCTVIGGITIKDH